MLDKFRRMYASQQHKSVVTQNTPAQNMATRNNDTLCRTSIAWMCSYCVITAARLAQANATQVKCEIFEIFVRLFNFYHEERGNKHETMENERDRAK